MQPIVSEAPTVISSPWPAPSIPDADFAAHVLRHAERLADRPALVDAADGRTIRYGELASAARRTAAGLAARGFGPGDVLALYSPNLPEFVVAVLGAAMTGGATTTANPLYTAAELASQLRDSGARIVVTIPPFADRATEAARAAGVETVLGFGDLAAGGEPPAVDVAPDDVVLLPYSSGTTGLPKGVEITHRAAVAQLAQLEPTAHARSRGHRPRRRADVPLHGPDRRGRERARPGRHGRHDDALRVRALPPGHAGPSRDRDGDRSADRARPRRPSRRRRLRPVRAALGRLRRGPPRRPDRGDLRAPAAAACSGRATA